MMTVYFFSTVSIKGATDATAVQSVDGIRLLKDSYYMFRLDGRQRCRSVKMVGDKDRRVGYGTNAHAVRVCGWWQADIHNSSDKTKQDIKYIEGDCPMQSNVHRKDAESAYLDASPKNTMAYDSSTCAKCTSWKI